MKKIVYLCILSLVHCLGTSAQEQRVDIAQITSMTPTSGAVGDSISLLCTRVRVTSPVKFTSASSGAYTSFCNWERRGTMDCLNTLVPAGAKTGPINVIQDGIEIPAGYFTVTKESSPDSDTDFNRVSRGGVRQGGGFWRAPPKNLDRYNSELDLPVDRPAPKKPEPPKPPEQIDEEKPPTIYGTEIKSENKTIIYVIDISGSMGMDLQSYQGADGVVKKGDRLDRAKTELTKSIDSLPSSFKFTILAYDCDVYYWSSEFVEATTANKTKANTWVMDLKPLGSTGTGLAVGTALMINRQNLLVILLTDGDPNCNSITMSGNVPPEVHRKDIARANIQGAIINVFGIACRAGSAMEAFCQVVAQDNHGFYISIR